MDGNTPNTPGTVRRRMMFELDVRSRKPIYEQLMDQLKELVMTEVLKEKERLPSVRALAKELTINPNTIQKAFRQLEMEGFIYTLPGKGSFVSPPNEVRNTMKQEKIKNELAKIVREALFMGMDIQDIYRIIQQTKEGIGGESRD
jgi:GntR family transcriptional regulator